MKKKKAPAKPKEKSLIEKIDTDLSQLSKGTMTSQRMQEIREAVSSTKPPTLFYLLEEYIPELIKELDRFYSQEQTARYYATALRKVEVERIEARQALVHSEEKCRKLNQELNHVRTYGLNTRPWKP